MSEAPPAGAPHYVWALYLILPVIATVAVTLINNRSNRQHRQDIAQQGEAIAKQSQVIGEVREQVSNSHPTNLRDDMDQVIAGVERLLRGQERHDSEISGIRKDIGGVRSEIRQVREDASNDRARLDRHLNRDT